MRAMAAASRVASTSVGCGASGVASSSRLVPAAIRRTVTSNSSIAPAGLRAAAISRLARALSGMERLGDCQR